MLSRFLNSEKANIAIIAAISLLPITVIAGGALDMLVTMNRLSEVRQATHASVMALANLNNSATDMAAGEAYKEQIQLHIRQMLHATISDPHAVHFLDPQITYETDIGYKNFTLTTDGYVETNFLRLAGIEAIPFSYSASAIQKSHTAEISLVLDISSSMKGTRIATLREASKNFVDLVLGKADPGTTTVSIIPFGGTVNLGPDLFSQYAAYTGSESTIVNPDAAIYAHLDNAHQSYQARFPDSPYHCLEFPSADYVAPDSILTWKSYSQVPSFWKWHNFHNWCPAHGAQSVFISEDRDALHTVLDRMSLSDGTGTDIGMLWGYKALSPNWRGRFSNQFRERPLDYHKDTNLKVLVVMTDGGVTAQFRPVDYTLHNTHTDRPNNDAPLDYDQQVSTNYQGNNQNQQMLYERGSTSVTNQFGFNPDSPRESAIDHFLRICHFARENNIIVYTISFNLIESGWPNQLMQSCASDPSKHYLVNTLDLETAFEAIAGSISSLRLTG